MLFRKKDSPDDRKISLKKADVLITGVILGGIVASIYGVKKARNAGESPSAKSGENPDESIKKKKPNFFFRLYHAIRYGQDYDGDSHR
ncbi:MAG TPA: hypothetical protein PK765_05730 [bacterium]|nr:hypothetical protein [bacterium]